MDAALLIAFIGVALPLGAVPGPDWMFMLSAAARHRLVMLPAAGLTAGHLLIVTAVALGVGPLVTEVPQVMVVLALVGGAYLIHLGISALRGLARASALAPAPASATDAPKDAATGASQVPATGERVGTGSAPTGTSTSTATVSAVVSASVTTAAVTSTASAATQQRERAAVQAVAPAAVRAQLLRQGLAVATTNPKSWLFYLVLIPQFARPEAAWPLTVQMAIYGLVFAASCMASALAVGVLADRVIGPRPRVGRVITRLAAIIMIVLGVVLLAEQAVHLLRP